MVAQKDIEKLEKIMRTETFVFVQELIENKPDIFKSEDGMKLGLFHMAMTIINAIDAGDIEFKNIDIRGITLALLALVLNHIEPPIQGLEARKLDS